MTSALESSPPCALGLPDKFDSWRPGQPRIIEDIIDCETPFKASCAPTGVGKSISYVAAAVLSGARACILTSTKGLQDQVESDFGSIGLVNIKGKGNYSCEDKLHLTCEEAWPVCKAKDAGECPWRQAYEDSCKAPLVVTSYSCWLNRNKRAPGAFTRISQDEDAEVRPFDMLILDEAHDAPEELASFVAVELTDEEIQHYCAAPVPDHTLQMNEWKDFAQICLPRVKLRISDTEAALRAHMHLDDKALRTYNRLSRIRDKLTTLATCNVDMWVVEPSQYGFKFDPVWPGVYSKHLFQGIPRIVMVSATLRPKTLYLLGLKDDQYTFDEYPSPFSPNDAPIYHIPTTKVWYGSTEEELNTLYRRIDQVLQPRQDRKGIVHTVSFKRATDIRYALESMRDEYRDSILTNGRSLGGTGLKTPDAVARFKQAKPPMTLISPSVSTGYDFPADRCEYNVIAKLSVSDPRTLVMKERLKRDPEYGDYLTVQDLVQACGRGNRFIGDRCQNFILDDSIRRFIWRRRHLLPKYFFDFFRTSGVVPAPLAKMPSGQ